MTRDTGVTYRPWIQILTGHNSGHLHSKWIHSQYSIIANGNLNIGILGTPNSNTIGRCLKKIGDEVY